MSNKPLEFVHVELKKDTWQTPSMYIHNPDDIINKLGPTIADLDRETLLSVNMATSGQVINASVCAIGTLSQAFSSPAEILRTAILSGGKSIIIMHNHPSGDVHPSMDDIKATKRLANAASYFDIQLLDSIIIGRNEIGYTYYSFLENNLYEHLEPSPDIPGMTLTANHVSETALKYTATNDAVSNKGKYNVHENRKAIVNDIIERIEKGGLQWFKRWASAPAPYNPLSGAEYQGGNRIRLTNAIMRFGYKDPRWMTFKQASEKGYKVKKGEHGVMLEKWIFTQKEVVLDDDGKPLLDDNGKKITQEVVLPTPKCNFFTVFNAEQIEDFPKYEIPNTLPDNELTEVIENLEKSSAAKIVNAAQDRACYSSGMDQITMPLKSMFTNNAAYLSTLSHEMTHSTGHKSRFDRFKAGATFGSPAYAREELIAELGSAFIMGDLHVPVTDEINAEHASYLQSWINQLRENPNILFTSAKEASQGADFIIKRYELAAGIRLHPEIEEIPDGPFLNKDKEAAEQKSFTSQKSKNQFHNYEQRENNGDEIQRLLNKRFAQMTEPKNEASSDYTPGSSFDEMDSNLEGPAVRENTSPNKAQDKAPAKENENQKEASYAPAI